MAQEEEAFVVPEYKSWKKWFFEPFPLWQFHVKGWQVVHLVVWLGVLVVWFSVTEDRWYEAPWWIYGWGPLLLLLFVILDSSRVHRLLTYMGWFYLLRGPNQAPIMELYM